MLHRFVHLAIAVFWIATMAAVAEHERRGSVAGVALLAPPRIEPRPMERFRILFGGRDIGTVTNEIVPESGGGVRVESRTKGDVPILGVVHRIDLRVFAEFDRASRLESLQLDGELAGTRFAAVGTMKDGELEIRGAGPLAPPEAVRVRVPSGAWIQPGAGVLAAIPVDARAGDRWAFTVLSPFSYAVEEATGTVLAERVDEAGRRVRDVELTIGKFTSRAVVDASGALLREDAPFGLSLERVGEPPTIPVSPPAPR